MKRAANARSVLSFFACVALACGWTAVAQRIPEFVHGDECLFCHRNDIGPSWQKNAHGITIRQVEDAPELQHLKKQIPQTEYFLGSRHRVRFLKKEGYGRFALLNTQAVLGPDRKVEKWIDLEKPAWDRERFANRCAGCHATAVDPDTRAFAAFGLDCYTCHGNVNLEHTNDTSLIWLSKKRQSDARAVTSICAQCHLRGGKSRSTGLPYPAAFVAGNDLFRDYEVDFSRADGESLNPGDRHVLRNVRNVIQRGSETLTCLGCHRVHANSSSRHRLALRSPICFDCHNTTGPFKAVKTYTMHSSLCEY